MLRGAAFCLSFLLVALIVGASHTLYAQNPAPPSQASVPVPSVSEGATKQPTTPAPSLKEAQELYLAGKFDKAVDRYYATIANDPGNSDAYVGLARAYLKLGKPADAYVAATKAIQQNSSLASAHSALGEVYFRQGKPNQALEEFLAASKLSDTDARAYLGLSRVYQATYDFRKAKLAIDKAYSLDPADPDVADAWIDTRPRVEQIKDLHDKIAARSNYYSRSERAGFRQRLNLLDDQLQHPERTCRLVSPTDNALLTLATVGPKKEFISVPSQVNGVAARLVLSTVSSGIVINRKIAEDAKVLPVARADLDALGEQNPPEVYIGFAPILKIQDLEFQDCYVTVIEKAAPNSFYEQFDGSIAGGFFSGYGYLMQVDIPNRTLQLQSLQSRPLQEDQNSSIDSSDPDARNFHDRYVAPEMGAWARMYRFGSAILIPVAVNSSPPELFEVASSSEFNLLSPDFAQKWAVLGAGKKMESAGLEGVNGRVSTPVSGKATFDFAGFHLNKVRVLSVDDTRSSEAAGIQVSGFLGFELLRNFRITIDYRDGLIHFESSQRSP
jgi:tetratricopeptide (TPR) repeat protein